MWLLDPTKLWLLDERRHAVEDAVNANRGLVQVLARPPR